MYYIFFVYSSIDGHLGCFHVLAIADGAAVTIGCMRSLGPCLSLDTCPEIGLQGRMVVLGLLF